MNKIAGVIFDWAGTTIDYGCFAPLHVFVKIFADKGVNITIDEARKPMGLLKIEHIRTITEMPRVREEWVSVLGTEPTEEDIVAMNNAFEQQLFKVLPEYTDPLPGVLDVVAELRNRGLKIGSTTGYTREMMDVVVEKAKEKGYSPDFYTTAEDVKEGRPAPWMCYYNAMQLGIYPMNRFIKVGDTVSDMKEGRNGGMVTVGVILGSSVLGLSQEEVNALNEGELKEKMTAARRTFEEAGAHYVIDQMEDLLPLLEQIEKEEVHAHA
ncbi:phosphonoacetaldehyde hydrolase [Bacillaceae bacterium SIJ1]|uniref:phosphonoacetaldehyde hydrolase n=1 Tax=Litoribacterium kuwaitense TaxID=1398745 RepID=UPI0013ED82F8|nr:phosphonoacetaldehyde hydrolase [Litoribacterium kuwaitense]NGP44917.1 phosphonoacetaldehyde hydrolase [Litoribacterium kuwaitense]